MSSIAWLNEEEQSVATALKKAAVRSIELAPTKLWNNPTLATDKQIADVMDYWSSNGQDIVAFQSMLFGREDLHIFESEANRQETLQYMKEFIRLAGKMQVGVLVFGSPKNRQRGALSHAEATVIATDFFRELGRTAEDNNTILCIEPNPVAYACDFITDAAQGIALVDLVNTKGFGLHLDIAGMVLAEDNITESVTAASPLLKHFHISAPQLGQVGRSANMDIEHELAAKALKRNDYQGYISIEMRPGDSGKNAQRVTDAVMYSKAVYGKYLG